MKNSIFFLILLIIFCFFSNMIFGDGLIDEINDISIELIAKDTGINDKISKLNFIFNESSIIINKQRDMYFFIKSDNTEYKKLTLDSEKIVEKEDNTTLQEATTYINGITINQSIEFFKYKTLKMVHIVDKEDIIDDFTFYYSFKLFENDSIEINGSLCHYDGKCTRQYYIDRDYAINFNKEYDFRIDDLLSTGFYMSDIEFSNNRLNIGFQTNSKSSLIELDPTFTTRDAEDIVTHPINKTAVAMAYCDETGDDVYLNVSTVDGYSILPELELSDGSVGACTYGELDITAFNNTHVVVASADGNDVNLHIVDLTTGIFTNFTVSTTSNPGEISIDNCNSSGLVVASNADTSIDGIIVTTLNYFDNSVTKYKENIFNNDTIDDGWPSVNCFNETTFVVAYYEKRNDRLAYRIFDFDLNEIVGETFVSDPDIGLLPVVKADVINNTAFVIGYYNDEEQEDRYTLIHVDGTEIIPPSQSIDLAGSVFGRLSISKYNDSAFIMTDYFDDEANHTVKIISFNNETLLNNVQLAQTFSASFNALDSKTADVISPSLIENKFFLAYQNGTSDSHIEYFNNDATIWNGSYSNPSYLENGVNVSYELQEDAWVLSYDNVSGFVSDIFNINPEHSRINISWNSTEPSGTNISMEFRTNNITELSPGNLIGWWDFNTLEYGDTDVKDNTGLFVDFIGDETQFIFDNNNITINTNSRFERGYGYTGYTGGNLNTPNGFTTKNTGTYLQDNLLDKTNFSMCAWFNFNGTGGGNIFRQHSSFAFRCNQNNATHCDITIENYNESSKSNPFWTNKIWKYNTWILGCYIKNEVISGTYEISLIAFNEDYPNGFTASKTFTNGYYNITTRLGIGTSGIQYNGINGTVDEAFIWNVSLTEEQIKKIYDQEYEWITRQSEDYISPSNEIVFPLNVGTGDVRFYSKSNNTNITPYLSDYYIEDYNITLEPPFTDVISDQIENLTSPSNTSNSAYLVWNLTVNVTKSLLYQNGTNIINITAPTFSYNITGLSTSTAYNFTIFAYNAAGTNETVSSENSITVVTQESAADTCACPNNENWIISDVCSFTDLVCDLTGYNISIVQNNGYVDCLRCNITCNKFNYYNKSGYFINSIINYGIN